MRGYKNWNKSWIVVGRHRRSEEMEKKGQIKRGNEGKRMVGWGGWHAEKGKEKQGIEEGLMGILPSIHPIPNPFKSTKSIK